MLQPETYVGLVAHRDAAAPSGVRFGIVYDIYSDAGAPADKMTYRFGELDKALLWGTNLKQLKNFAAYLFGKGDLLVAAQPLRHDPRVALFSARR